MASTANYGWTKPVVGGDDDAWGGEWNVNLDGIDSVVHGVQTSKYDAANPSGYQTAAQVTAALAPYALTTAIPAPSSTTPIMDGTAAVGTGTTWARADHVHPKDTTKYDTTNPAGYQTAGQVNVAIAAAAYVLPTASTTVLGGVRVDGSTITIAGGVISGASQQGPPVTVSATPPASPAAGALWWDSVGGQMYVWYQDVNSSQWVPVSNAASPLPPATTTTLGGVKVDGSTIVAAPDGTITVKRATPFPFCFPGKPSASAKLGVVMPWAATIAVNFANSQTYADTVATSAAAFAVFQKTAGVSNQVGTITITAGSTAGRTFSAASIITLAAGDLLQIVAPATQDATLADVSFTIWAAPT